jgi:8-oxo-dGTP pyrophosphatase MutT (NUDIX family)
MPHERSAGAVIFFKSGTEIEYLVLEYYQHHWDFPRGHVEPGETDAAAARREIQEETGLADLEFIPDFQEKTSWFYRRRGAAKPFYKEAVYFLARSQTKEVIISPEHHQHLWLTYAQTLRRITFMNARGVLKKADEFLTARKHQ